MTRKEVFRYITYIFDKRLKMGLLLHFDGSGENAQLDVDGGDLRRILKELGPLEKQR